MKENIFMQSEIQSNEAIQYTSKKKECPPGFYVNGKCTEPTVSIDGYLWVLVVVGACGGGYLDYLEVSEIFSASIHCRIIAP